MHEKLISIQLNLIDDIVYWKNSISLFLQIKATREKFYSSGGFLMKWNVVWSREQERIQNANDPLDNINLGGSRCFTVIDSLTHCARYYGECSNFIHETWWKNDALYEVTSIFPGTGIIDMDVKRWLNKSVERKIHLLFWLGTYVSWVRINWLEFFSNPLEISMLNFIT